MLPKYGSELKATWKSSGELSGSLIVNDKLVNRLKTEVNVAGALSSDDAVTVAITNDYKRTDSTFSAQFVKPLGAPSISANLSGVFFRNAWAFGLQHNSVFNTEETTFDKSRATTGASVQYTNPSFVSSFSLTKRGNNLLGNFRYFFVSSRGYLVASEFACDHRTNNVNASFALAKDNKKITVASNGDVGVSYKKTLDENSNVTLGLKTNTDTRKFNIGLHVECSM